MLGSKSLGGVFHLPDHAVCEPVRAQERCGIVCRHTHMNTVHRRFCFERSFVHCSAGSLAGFFCVVLLRVVKPTPEQQILNPLQSQFAGSCISRCPLPRSMVSTHTTQTSRPSKLRRRFMASQTGGKCCVARHAGLFREASATHSESRTGFPRLREVFENRELLQPCRVELTFSPQSHEKKHPVTVARSWNSDGGRQCHPSWAMGLATCCASNFRAPTL